jgi:hypothetical protein
MGKKSNSFPQLRFSKHLGAERPPFPCSSRRRRRLALKTYQIGLDNPRSGVILLETNQPFWSKKMTNASATVALTKQTMTKMTTEEKDAVLLMCMSVVGLGMGSPASTFFKLIVDSVIDEIKDKEEACIPALLSGILKTQED